MATVKIVLRKKENKDGTYPLAIRITQDRKTSFIHLGKHLNENNWDAKEQRAKKSYPNFKRLNNFLIAKLAEANDKALELETTKHTTAKAVSQKIKPKAGDTVFSQADLYIKRLKEEGKYNRWNSEKSNVLHLKNFLKSDIAFQDLTITLLERFKVYLKTKERKVSERTAINNLITVRSIFSQAIKEGACDAKYYPFGKGKIKIKFPDTKKLGLTAEEVASIEKTELDAEGNHARNIWLLSYYFAGIRVSDVFRLMWSDFRDGRLYYTMGKNAKGDSLKVSEKVSAILAQYEDKKVEGSDLIFPELLGVDLNDKFETQRIISSRINSIDRVLRKKVAPAAKITKPLTMHISRHTFGNISGDKIPIQMLQKLYRHTDIKTTIGYQANFIHKDVDEALEAVIGM